MNKILFWFAVTGWVLGLIVHILSLAGFDVAEKIPFIWILHIGIFVVWIPAILELRKSKELTALQSSGRITMMNPITFFTRIGKNAPKWMMVVAIGGIFYAFFNFLFFMFSDNGTPAIQNGQYVLQNHGQWMKDISAQQYHRDKANTLRGFSGHWIAFYGMAMLVLFPSAQTRSQITRT